MDNATKYITSAYAHKLDAETLTLINEGIENALDDKEFDHFNHTTELHSDIDDLKRENSNYQCDIDELKNELSLLKSSDDT